MTWVRIGTELLANPSGRNLDTVAEEETGKTQQVQAYFEGMVEPLVSAVFNSHLWESFPFGGEGLDFQSEWTMFSISIAMQRLAAVVIRSQVQTVNPGSGQ